MSNPARKVVRGKGYEYKLLYGMLCTVHVLASILTCWDFDCRCTQGYDELIFGYFYSVFNLVTGTNRICWLLVILSLTVLHSVDDLL